MNNTELYIYGRVNGKLVKEQIKKFPASQNAFIQVINEKNDGSFRSVRDIKNNPDANNRVYLYDSNSKGRPLSETLTEVELEPLLGFDNIVSAYYPNIDIFDFSTRKRIFSDTADQFGNIEPFTEGDNILEQKWNIIPNLRFEEMKSRGVDFSESVFDVSENNLFDFFDFSVDTDNVEISIDDTDFTFTSSSAGEFVTLTTGTLSHGVYEFTNITLVPPENIRVEVLEPDSNSSVEYTEASRPAGNISGAKVTLSRDNKIRMTLIFNASGSPQSFLMATSPKIMRFVPSDPDQFPVLPFTVRQFDLNDSNPITADIGAIAELGSPATDTRVMFFRDTEFFDEQVEWTDNVGYIGIGSTTTGVSFYKHKFSNQHRLEGGPALMYKDILTMTVINVSHLEDFEKQVIKEKMVELGALDGNPYTNVTDFDSGFNSSWADFSVVSMPDDLDLSNGTTFNAAWQNLTALAEFPPSLFDDVTATDFTNAFDNCGLTQESVDNILVSINNAGTSDGTLDIDGGTSAAPSAIGLAAKSELEGRGWTVTTN